VLAVKPEKALISIRRCDFEVNIKDKVTADRVHGLDKSTDRQTVERRKRESDENIDDDEEQRKEMSTARYAIGGIMGTFFFGAGMGHLIQGRYFDDGGWMHTAAQLTTITMSIYGFVAAGICYADFHCSIDKSKGLAALGYLGLTFYSASRLWEIISVWYINEDKYEIVSKPKAQQATYSLLPILSNNGDVGLSLAISLPVK